MKIAYLSTWMKKMPHLFSILIGVIVISLVSGFGLSLAFKKTNKLNQRITKRATNGPDCEGAPCYQRPTIIKKGAALIKHEFAKEVEDDIHVNRELRDDTAERFPKIRREKKLSTKNLYAKLRENNRKIKLLNEPLTDEPNGYIFAARENAEERLKKAVKLQFFLVSLLKGYR